MDVEALEYALRLTHPMNSLTQRVRVLCYLAEAHPQYFERFVNDTPHFGLGLATMVLLTVRSVYKLLKGRWLMRVHDVR